MGTGSPFFLFVVAVTACLGAVQVFAAGPASVPPPTCEQRTSAMHLRGGSTFSKWFADANEDLLDEESKPAAAAPAAKAEEKGEEEQTLRCEQISKRLACKARKDCIYDTARGCYTRSVPKPAPAPPAQKDKKPGVQL